MRPMDNVDLTLGWRKDVVRTEVSRALREIAGRGWTGRRVNPPLAWLRPRRASAATGGGGRRRAPPGSPPVLRRE